MSLVTLPMQSNVVYSASPAVVPATSSTLLSGYSSTSKPISASGPLGSVGALAAPLTAIQGPVYSASPAAVPMTSVSAAQPAVVQLAPAQPAVMTTSPLLAQPGAGQLVPAQLTSTVSTARPVVPTTGQLVAMPTTAPRAVTSDLPPQPSVTAGTPGKSAPARFPVERKTNDTELRNTQAHPNPAKTYICDGKSIKDETGAVVALVKPREKDNGTNILSPEGEVLLQYTKKNKNLKDMRTKRVIAVMGQKEKAVYHGDPAMWKNKKQPPKIYTYEIDESDGVNLNIWVYDTKSGQHIATVSRLSTGHYPSSIAIEPNTPYHMLLLSIFLI
eukprot:TRINITY_DN68068_c1_g1_i1.p1 TRINITY_DN68068_c1_g1~~TRINITY_DN68068_c1_g1_i1.p1  ORF type:complete len:330 (-),score=36.31 TRINITY_DN68068_c1_g1_i1:1013-2002(-)